MIDNYEWERQNILEKLPGYDPSFIPIHYAAWNDYEENGYMFILRKDSQLYVFNYQYSVFSDDNSEYWNPIPVSDNEALSWMLGWEEHEEYEC